MIVLTYIISNVMVLYPHVLKIKICQQIKQIFDKDIYVTIYYTSI